MEMMMFVNVVAGAVLAVIIGQVLPRFSVGSIGNSTVAGGLGGFVLGQIVHAFSDSVSTAAAAADTTTGSLALFAIIGAIGGAILQIAIGLGLNKKTG